MEFNQTNRVAIRTHLQNSGIEYLSFSSMKELRNNEAMFLKHYINYEWDTLIYCATIIGKSCHHGIELFYGDPKNISLFETDSKLVIEKITKRAKDYAKSDYISKNKKPDDFWTAKKMIAYGWFTEIVKLVDQYEKLKKEIFETPADQVVDETKVSDLESLENTIKETIEKAKKKDEKLDDFINYGKTWSIESIMEGIERGIKNWFDWVYPKVKNWTLIGSELERKMDVLDLNGEPLTLPIKFIIDAIYEDENDDLIIVDWKFKSELSNDTSVKPEYDMQGSTYCFGTNTAFDRMPIKALFIEIMPKESKCAITLQADLRKACGDCWIDREKGNNGKWMTNPMMTQALIEKWAVELKPVVYEYVVDFIQKHYLLDIWLIFYNQTVKRLYQLVVEWDDFMINIFDGNFDGGISVYKDWISQFTGGDDSQYDESDAVDL